MECKAIEQADEDPIRTVATAAHDAGEEHVLHWHFFKTNDYRVLCTFFDVAMRLRPTHAKSWCRVKTTHHTNANPFFVSGTAGYTIHYYRYKYT
jgi:hypothetical protein